MVSDLGGIPIDYRNQNFVVEIRSSIQTLKRLKPDQFRQDLVALLVLLQTQQIKPIVAERFPRMEARQAHEVLGKGGVIGKIVLVMN